MTPRQAGLALAGVLLCLEPSLSWAKKKAFHLPTSPADVPPTRPQDRVIFSKEEAPQRWSFGQRPTADFWTPALDDVVKMERDLPTYLQGEFAVEWAPPNRIPLWRKAFLYKRQYVGLFKDGRRIIQGNFLCETEELKMQWRRVQVVVLDGGDCYFQISYDVVDRTFSALVINGEA